MARRTISLPDSIDQLIRENRAEGETYSAAIARLVTEGASGLRGAKRPRYVASGEGPSDLGRLAEEYLRDVVQA